MKKALRLLIAGSAVVAVPAMAQRPPTEPGAQLVTAAELLGAIPASDRASVVDRMLRLIPIGSEYNVAVSVVRRTRVGGRTPSDALQHREITEVYHVLEGRGVLVTGGTLVEARALDSSSATVRHLIGPSSVGTAISGGTAREVGPGDVIVIPPGTAHGFVRLQTEQIRYMLIRVDPNRVLQPR